MRVTQTERPFSMLDIKIPLRAINDENDPLRCNTINGVCQEKEKTEHQNNERQNKKLTKLRRQYLKKIEDIQKTHCSQLIAINKKHQEQTNSLTAKYKIQLMQKQQYIQLLEGMINHRQPLLQTKKQFTVDQSKYIKSENIKNHVPHYEEISDRIDFKLEPRAFEKKLSLDSRSAGGNIRKIVQSYSTQQCHNLSTNQSSKHKLIPKSKPSDSHPQERDNQISLSSYKNCKSVKIPRPFFL